MCGIVGIVGQAAVAAQHDLVAVRLGDHTHGTILASVLHRVRDEIGDDLAQAVAVPFSVQIPF